MKKTIKRITVLFCLFLCLAQMMPLMVFASIPENSKILLSKEEQALVTRTQKEAPLSMGIIPHAFPLSECPPDAMDFVGLNVEMLDKVSEISGLQFKYERVPLEEKTPLDLLLEGKINLVAGTIKLDSFLNNDKLILSDRLCDGTAGCIAKKGTHPEKATTGKVAVKHGYQAGQEFATELFPRYEIVTYFSNQKALKAVRNGDADLAIMGRYVGIYELQSPLNEKLAELTLYKMEKDSCVMGLNTPENQVAISIINKALAAIGDEGYNALQMNFSLMNPYKLTFIELLYKYRYILLTAGVALAGLCFLTVRLLYTQKEHKRLSMDSLTGAYTEAGFELAVAKILPKSSTPLFITDFDIYHFSSYNELNGKEEGDALLRNIVKIVKTLLCEQDIICRCYADHFKVLSSKASLEDLIGDISKAIPQFNAAMQSMTTINFGIYPVKNHDVPIAKMLDFAAMAKKNVKGNPNEFIGVFDEELLDRYIREAKMTSTFERALANQEFVAYYQPKFDTETTIIGAEALVRWVAEDGTVIPPIQFIELFEKSGQIQELDFFMLEKVCILLHDLMGKNLPVYPIAVNFSRVHLYSGEFAERVNAIVERYGLPKHLIEIECTETTMLDNIDLTRAILGKLQAQGFSIAMDDFGSAYSSLNTLWSIPLDIIKLDGGFLMATLSHEKAKSDIIISSVIRLAHELSLKVVAEGVETEEQYQFLKSLDCDFIQGYYYSKPLNEKDFLELLKQQRSPAPKNDGDDGYSI